MKLIDVHRVFELDILSNLISNIIIEEFNKLDQKNVSYISVTDHHKFFVVEGTTSIQFPFNVSEVVNKELSRLCSEHSEYTDFQPVNIIDIIQYNFKEKNLLSYRKYFSKYLSKSEPSSKRTPVISSPFYGMSNHTEKSYIMLVNYIQHTMFESNLCNDVTISISSNEPIESIHVDNIDLFIKSDNLITTEKWAKSLILDIFPFQLGSIIKDMDLYNYNYENMILKKGELPYQNRRKLKDIVLM